MSLHDRIMECLECPPVASYDKAGYAMGISDAAKLAKEADELMAEMAELIDGYKLIMQEMGVKPNRTDVLLDKYNAWKESTK